MAKNNLVECVVQSVDCVMAIHIPPIITGHQILKMVLRKYGIYEVNWFTFFRYDPQYQERRVIMNEQMNIKDVVSYPTTKIILRLAVALYPTSSRVELIQDYTRIMFFRFELKRSIEDFEYDLLPEWRALLLVGYGRLTEYENPHKSHLTAIEQKFDGLMPTQILEKYGHTRESMLTVVKNLLHETRHCLLIELVQHILELLETSTQYGVKFFSIKNKNGTHLLLGVDSTGVIFYMPTDRINPVAVFKWAEMSKIAYMKKKLTITLSDKEEHPLEFELMHHSQNRLLFYTITEHHEYFWKGKKSGSDKNSESAIKAREVQSVSMTKMFLFRYIRNPELVQQIHQEKYNDTLNKILNEGKFNEANISELEKDFLRMKETFEQQIDQNKKEIEEDSKAKEGSQNNSEICNVNVESLKKTISDTRQEKENTEIFADEIKHIKKKPEAEIAQIQEKIEQLQLKHKSDLENFEKATKAPLIILTVEEINDAKATLPSFISNELQVKREEALKNTIQKVSDSSKSTCIPINEDIKNLQEFSEKGSEKFTTLTKLAEENRIRERIEMFESLK